MLGKKKSGSVSTFQRLSTNTKKKKKQDPRGKGAEVEKRGVV